MYRKKKIVNWNEKNYCWKYIKITRQWRCFLTIVFIVNTPRRCFPQIFLLCAKVTENLVIFYHFWGCQNRHKNLQIRSSIIFQFSPAHHPRSFVYVSKINLACFNMNRKEKNFIVRIISILFVYIFMRILEIN